MLIFILVICVVGIRRGIWKPEVPLICHVICAQEYRVSLLRLLRQVRVIKHEVCSLAMLSPTRNSAFNDHMQIRCSECV